MCMFKKSGQCEHLLKDGPFVPSKLCIAELMKALFELCVASCLGDVLVRYAEMKTTFLTLSKHHFNTCFSLKGMGCQ